MGFTLGMWRAGRGALGVTEVLQAWTSMVSPEPVTPWESLTPVPPGPCRLGSPEGEVKIKQRPVKPGGAGKLEKVPGRRKAGGCPEGSKKKLKAKAKESLRPTAPGCPSPSGPPSSLFGGSDPRLLGTRDEGARLGERGKKGTRKSKGLQAALRVSGGWSGLRGREMGCLHGLGPLTGPGQAGMGLLEVPQ